MFDGLGNVGRFHRVEVHRLALIDCTKSAVPRASVAAEHERGGLVRPAFKDIRAFRFLTDRVQIQPVDQLENRVLIARIAELDLQPIRLLEAVRGFCG